MNGILLWVGFGALIGWFTAQYSKTKPASQKTFSSESLAQPPGDLFTMLPSDQI